jgi:hypothetical protein
MIQSANDWASPDPTQNMTLAAAITFCDALAGSLQVQFASRYILTTENQIIPEAELRANPFILPLPVNLYGYLVAQDSQPLNIAQFQASLQQAALAEDPTGTLCQILGAAMPETDVPDQFTRIPAVQQVLLDALLSL